MNEMLRRALFRARLTEEDIAAHLGVDPKTVRRWLEGRIPYPRHRLAVSHILGADEADLWPEVHVARIARSWPEGVKAIYPHRWAVPHEVWHHFFGSAQHKIDVLAYSALFLANDIGILGVFAHKARTGVRVRIAISAPDSPHIIGGEAEESIGEVFAPKIVKALALYRPLLAIGNVELRLHQAALYSSVYRADDDLLVNQHIYGIETANAPVIHLRKVGSADLFSSYLDNLRQVWSTARSLVGPT